MVIMNNDTIVTLNFCRLCIHKKEIKEKKMCNQYEEHKVYFYYWCLKYDFIGYMTSSCHDE